MNLKGDKYAELATMVDWKHAFVFEVFPMVLGQQPFQFLLITFNHAK
jgi:hypothetical protein